MYSRLLFIDFIIFKYKDLLSYTILSISYLLIYIPYYNDFYIEY